MKRIIWVVVALIIGLSAIWTMKRRNQKPEQKPATQTEQVKDATYWTCPMHPQIHSDKPGECPICHMKLVQVKAQGGHAAHIDEKESRAMVSASQGQLQLVGVQKIAVEKMDLKAHVPISGRFISSSTVAFQVYESDLRYVKSGLKFRGQSSFRPEAELIGTIASVDSIVDPTSRTVRVVGHIEKGPKGLISETTFSGEIEIILKDVTAIPESAVLHTGMGDIAYMVHDDGSLMAQPVTLGQKAESYFEVVDGLTPGEFISSGPNFLIDSEAKIRGAGGGASGHANH